MMTSEESKFGTNAALLMRGGAEEDSVRQRLSSGTMNFINTKGIVETESPDSPSFNVPLAGRRSSSGYQQPIDILPTTKKS